MLEIFIARYDGPNSISAFAYITATDEIAARTQIRNHLAENMIYPQGIDLTKMETSLPHVQIISAGA